MFAYRRFLRFQRAGFALCGFVLWAIFFSTVPKLSFAQSSDDTHHTEVKPHFEKVQAIEESQRSIEELIAHKRKASGVERDSIDKQLVAKRAELRSIVAKWVETLVNNPDQDEETSKLVLEAKRLLRNDAQRLDREAERTKLSLSQTLNQFEKAEESERVKIELEIAQLGKRSVELLEWWAENLRQQQQLGAAVEPQLQKLDRLVSEKARTLAARIEAFRKEKSARPKSPVGDSETADAQKAVMEALDERIARNSEFLRRVVELMKQRDLDATEYQQLLIAATGRVTTDVLEAEVTLGLLERWWAQAEDWAMEAAPRAMFGALVFVLILLATRIVAVMLRKAVRRSIQKTDASQLAKDFVVSLTSKLVMVLGIMLALSQLGVEIGPLIAGLGIAGFIVGFALQDTLSNFASGIMILIYRPYDVGDFVDIAGITGNVHNMNLVSTSVLTLDNQRVVIPNSKIWTDVIRNVTAESTRRVDFIFGVAYREDIDQVRKVLLEIIAEQPDLLREPDPIVELHELADSSLNFTVRVWTQTQKYWPVYWAMNAAVKRRFDTEGISFPFPQRDVHLYQESTDSTLKESRS